MLRLTMQHICCYNVFESNIYVAKGDLMKNVKQQISVLIDRATKEKLQEKANENYRSLSGQIRAILKDYLAQQERI